jgi:Arc/MetJ family transcription regulator
MKALAKAVVDAAAFLELAKDDLIDPDAAVAALEMIAADLQGSSEAERIAVREAAEWRYREELEAGASQQTLEFFLHFAEHLSLEK